MEFKYIIVDRVQYVIFGHGIEHKDEANGRNVTDAGFVHFCLTHDGAMAVRCFGRSTSLGIGGSETAHRRSEKLILNAAINMMGMGAE